LSISIWLWAYACIYNGLIPTTDLRSTPGHLGYDDLTIAAALNCIPDSLYLLIKWMMTAISDGDDVNSKDDNDELHQLINSICQHIVFHI